MKTLFDGLATTGWSNTVECLLHSLWQAALLAIALWAALRFVARPRLRYRLAFAALLGVVAAALATWALLQEATPSAPAPGTPATPPASTRAGNLQADRSHPSTAGPAESTSSAALEPSVARPPLATTWTAWLAGIWLAGATLMLVRAGTLVAGAGRIRRASRPLDSGEVLALVEESCQAVGLGRRIRVVVADHCLSPAVMGVLVPTLVLPLSLISTFSPDQLRLILLHELAHVRRGDYLANLFQLACEALLFFNPAVWWISRQIRLEREVCCDAVAIELSGQPVDYARTLLSVAEAHYAPAPALGFSDHRSSSGLAERVRRLLTPGQPTHLRMTWRAVLLSAAIGVGLLMLSAACARLTVAAILTPEQRIERMRQVLAAHGEPVGDAAPDRSRLPAEFDGSLVTEDGSPLGSGVVLSAIWRSPRLTGNTSVSLTQDGHFRGPVGVGDLTLVASAPGYAPCALGPIRNPTGPELTQLRLTLKRGSTATLVTLDAETGKPIANAAVRVQFWPPGLNTTGLAATTHPSDAEGKLQLANVGELPAVITAQAPDYVDLEQRFDRLRPGEVITLKLLRGTAVAGRVTDKRDGRPIEGAIVQMLSQQGPQETSFGWDSVDHRVAVTDPEGRFVANRLRQDTRYWLGVSAPGRESVVLPEVMGGDTNLLAQLGPELVVHGSLVLPDQGSSSNTYPLQLQVTTSDRSGPNQYNKASVVRDLVNNPGRGSLDFTFTNRVAGPVEVRVAGRVFNRVIDAPIDDWRIDLTRASEASGGQPPPGTNGVRMRTIQVRLDHPSGVPPSGTIEVLLPYPEEPLTSPIRSYQYRSLPLQNGAVTVEVPVGAQFECRPAKSTLGYWFDPSLTQRQVKDGAGPIELLIPAVPAGVITARAWNADGTPAADLSFGILVARHSALVKNPPPTYQMGDSWSPTDGPRRFLSTPLPLDGTYQVVGWRGNAFALSPPVTLTDANPDQAVELRLTTGRAIEGTVFDANGVPVRGAEVKGLWHWGNHGFGLKLVLTDSAGKFRLEDATPGLGRYSLEIAGVAGHQVQRFDVSFSELPMSLRLQRGLRVTGRLREARTGEALASTLIRAFATGGEVPTVETHTGAKGEFEFSTLADATYMLYVEGASLQAPQPFKPRSVTNLNLEALSHRSAARRN